MIVFLDVNIELVNDILDSNDCIYDSKSVTDCLSVCNAVNNVDFDRFKPFSNLVVLLLLSLKKS